MVMLSEVSISSAVCSDVAFGHAFKHLVFEPVVNSGSFEKSIGLRLTHLQIPLSSVFLVSTISCGLCNSMLLV